MGNSRRWMRGIGAGLMEAGNQIQLNRREQLLKLREDNLMKIAEGRQSLMRDQLEQQKTQTATARTDTMADKFYNRVDAKINEAYGKAPLTAMESLILKASLENSITGNPMDVIKTLKEQGVLPESAKPSVGRLNSLYKTIESEWKQTIGKGENAGEFNMAEHINRFPLLQSGAEAGAVSVADPNSPESQALQEEVGGGGVIRGIVGFLSGDWMRGEDDEGFSAVGPGSDEAEAEAEADPNAVSTGHLSWPSRVFGLGDSELGDSEQEGGAGFFDRVAASWNTASMKGDPYDTMRENAARGWEQAGAPSAGDDLAAKLTTQAQHGHMSAPEAPLMNTPEVQVGPPAPPTPPLPGAPRWLDRKY